MLHFEVDIDFLCLLLNQLLTLHSLMLNRVWDVAYWELEVKVGDA